MYFLYRLMLMLMFIQIKPSSSPCSGHVIEFIVYEIVSKEKVYIMVIESDILCSII